MGQGFNFVTYDMKLAIRVGPKCRMSLIPSLHSPTATTHPLTELSTASLRPE